MEQRKSQTEILKQLVSDGHLTSDQADDIAERISKLEGRIDLTGLVELSEKDAKFFAKSPHVILSPEMEKVVDRYREKN